MKNSNKERSAVLYRDLTQIPAKVVSGQGVYFTDENGKTYLDGSASASVVSIGHGRSEIWDAMAAQGNKLTFVYAQGFTHPWQEQLARNLLDLAPPNMAAVYFTSGGSEANESAWKLARQYHVERGNKTKYKAIARWQSYHGVTLGTLSLSGRTSWRDIYAPMLVPVPHIDPPYRYRCAYCSGADRCSLACADDLERTILMEGPDTIAAFFVEPVVGTTVSGLVPDERYYRRIREICDKYDVLMVTDEVLCGYGRTGSAFAISQWDVQPDIITMGKGIGAGYAPLGAMLAAEKVRQVFAEGSGRFVHGFTYSGTPSATFVGLKVNEIMHREGLFTRAKSMEPFIQSALERLADRHAIIGEFRGRGLLWGVEFVADRQTRTPFPREFDLTGKIVRHMRDNGVCIAAGVPLSNFGKDGDHIQISPPLIIEEHELKKIFDALGAALTDISRLQRMSVA